MSEQYPHQPQLNGNEPIGEHLSFAVQDPAWFERMYCGDPTAEEFFVRAKGIADPLNLKEKYCDHCPVVDDCLASDILQGVSQATIRGGVGYGERSIMRRSIEMNRRYVPPTELPTYRYRNAGFGEQMSTWRAGLVDEIQDAEAVVFAIDKQIEAGTVLPDGYYNLLSDKLHGLRQQLSFIEAEEHRR